MAGKHIHIYDFDPPVNVMDVLHLNYIEIRERKEKSTVTVQGKEVLGGKWNDANG